MDELVHKAEEWTKAWATLPHVERAAYCQASVDRYGPGAAVMNHCFDALKEAK